MLASVTHVTLVLGCFNIEISANWHTIGKSSLVSYYDLYIFLLAALAILGLIMLSIITISWSEIPGMIDVLYCTVNK